uniref:Uncharacterized protein n=1 Tax=Chromera velia CCMP2878 TaxID=1169474 RepID=A0A0G4GD87_9ALVE|eukprot:Cvel_4541.t1-p1 / transcript=Cvel_4541.t1 / gene=Cvel_4541 / organism=Chromera_velia_CCMP2878 / gene_product=hypothetical protein / transcript_product=hypothetical protein / location=Cvel_scaffold199:31830-36597(-) / protein_length=118 / sequence_SO=supercontig / SO=protein_coding / is_pseudo=false
MGLALGEFKRERCEQKPFGPVDKARCSLATDVSRNPYKQGSWMAARSLNVVSHKGQESATPRSLHPPPADETKRLPAGRIPPGRAPNVDINECEQGRKSEAIDKIACRSDSSWESSRG